MFLGISLVIYRVAGRVRQRLPHAGWLVRLDPLPAHMRIEQFTRPKGDVTQNLGVETITRPTGEQLVFRIIQRRPKRGTLTKRLTANHQPKHVV